MALAVVTLAFSPWLPLAASERQPTPNGFPIRSPASRLQTTSPAELPVGPRPATQDGVRSDSYCLTCHSDPFLQTRFADGRGFALYVDARGLRDSAHALMTCLACHDDHEVYPPDRAEPLDFATYRTEATEMCIRCHLAAAGDYAQSVHAQPILSGNGEGATCSDCHSPEPSGHTVGQLSDPGSLLAPRSVDENCGRCHAQELDTYRQTSHNKVAQFGDPRRPATCITCHGDHAVTSVDDPNEPLTAARLATVCGRCHDGADESFASGWLGHKASPFRSTGFHYAERFIILSIAASLGFGLVHMTLDFVRALAGRWRRGGDNPG